MKPSEENWLDGVFESEEIGESLSKLTEEFDCLISCDKIKKNEVSIFDRKLAVFL